LVPKRFIFGSLDDMLDQWIRLNYSIKQWLDHESLLLILICSIVGLRFHAWIRVVGSERHAGLRWSACGNELEGGAAAINIRRMEIFCNLQLGHTQQPAHTLHRFRIFFEIMVCFIHLLCKVLFQGLQFGYTPISMFTHTLDPANHTSSL
jgi:hypothetical protein